MTTAIGYGDTVLGARLDGMASDPFTGKTLYSSNVVPIVVTAGTTLALLAGRTDRTSAILRATVTRSAENLTTPWGNIEFYDGDVLTGTTPLTPLPLCCHTPTSTEAERTVTGLADGAHVVTAEWVPGDPQTPRKRSGPAHLFVASVTSPPILSVDPPSPVQGQPVTFRAELPPGVPGTVQFSVARVEIPVSASGVATLTISTLPAGNYDVSAYYYGGETHWHSESSIPVTVVAAQSHAGTDVPAIDWRALIVLSALLTLAAAWRVRV